MPLWLAEKPLVLASQARADGRSARRRASRGGSSGWNRRTWDRTAECRLERRPGRGIACSREGTSNCGDQARPAGAGRRPDFGRRRATVLQARGSGGCTASNSLPCADARMSCTRRSPSCGTRRSPVRALRRGAPHNAPLQRRFPRTVSRSRQLLGNDQCRRLSGGEGGHPAVRTHRGRQRRRFSGYRCSSCCDICGGKGSSPPGSAQP